MQMKKLTLSKFLFELQNTETIILCFGDEMYIDWDDLLVIIGKYNENRKKKILINPKHESYAEFYVLNEDNQILSDEKICELVEMFVPCMYHSWSKEEFCHILND